MKGKTSDSFKKEHQVEVAQKVREVYRGPADLDQERVKLKFEDKYRPLWGKQQDYCSGLSGWTENEEGLLQSSEEVMDTYFAAHPEYLKFRYSLLTGYKQLQIILSNQVVTGEFADGFNVESSDKEVIKEIISLKDKEDDEDIHDLVKDSR